MAGQRLDGSERRNTIIEAALPLFARKGLAATTTREIAQAAGVSEGLIFKHFPSKAALYEAIVLSCVEGDPEMARLTALPPCTATMIQFVHALVRYFVFDMAAEPLDQSRHRLLVMSLLEDGEFARHVYRWVAEAIEPQFAASVRAAEATGDMVASPVPAEVRLRPAVLMGQMIATLNLPERPVLAAPFTGATDADRVDLANHAAWFILRGVGLRDAAIADHWIVPEGDHP